MRFQTFKILKYVGGGEGGGVVGVHFQPFIFESLRSFNHDISNISNTTIHGLVQCSLKHVYNI